MQETMDTVGVSLLLMKKTFLPGKGHGHTSHSPLPGNVKSWSP